jgi:hypothetical protein
MALSTTRPEGIYKFNTTLGDVDGKSASLIDKLDFDKGLLQLRGLEAGIGLKVSVVDADNGLFNTTDKKILLEVDGSLGETNTFSSLGDVSNGKEIIGTKVDADLQFKRVKGGSGILVNDLGTHLEVVSVASGAGEANDGVNVGTLGVGVYEGKEAATLQFRNIAPGSDKVTVALDANHNIKVDLDPSKMNIGDLTGSINVARVSGLATVATSGSYTDLSDKPSLFDGDYNHLSNKPTLFSGDYNDLTNRPYILNQTNVEDIVGGMVSGNTESNITVTYDSVNRKLNFVGGAALNTDTAPKLGGDLDVNGHKIVGDSIELKTTTVDGVIKINGIEYTGRKTAVILNNQSSEQTFYTFAATAFEAVMLDYVIVRGTDVRMGTLSIINNGTVSAFSDAGPDIGNVGVNFATGIVNGNVEVRYTSSNTGTNGEIAFMVRRWDANN